VVVSFVDIGGIVDHHCLNFHFTGVSNLAVQFSKHNYHNVSVINKLLCIILIMCKIKNKKMI
jgi:hypothetical protein